MVTLRATWQSLEEEGHRKGRRDRRSAGHEVGVIGRTGVNLALLRTGLVGSGIEPDKVATAQFGTEETEKLAQDATLDAYLAVGPLDSKITTDALAATSRSRGAPKCLPVEASEAIALKHARYEAEEIPGGVFNAKPVWPEDKPTPSASTISSWPETNCPKPRWRPPIGSFSLSATRSHNVRRRCAHHEARVGQGDGPSVRRGAAAVVNGTERTFSTSTATTPGSPCDFFPGSVLSPPGYDGI